MIKCENNIDEDGYEKKVEKQAYELYMKRGFEIGHDWDDWFEAEKQVEMKLSVVDKDCMRSESFYALSHRPIQLPSEISVKKVVTTSGEF